MNNEGAKRLFKCFGSDLEFTQAVCEDGQWTGANCQGIVLDIFVDTFDIKSSFGSTHSTV